jgi:hypothetical protein
LLLKVLFDRFFLNSSSIKWFSQKNEAKIAFTHILHVVIGRTASTPLQLTLEEDGIDDILELINLDAPNINNLQYIDSNNKNAITNIRTGYKMLLKCFLNNIGVRHNERNPIGNDWDQITQAEFDSFCIDPKYIISQPPKPSSTSIPASSNTRTLGAKHFNQMCGCGRKQDGTLFLVLKDDKSHDICHRSFKTQATAQAVSEFLDDSYIPITPDDIALFQEKQKYFYAILESKVLTDRGKALIWDHEHNFDAKNGIPKA